MQLLFLGASPERGAPGVLSPDLPIIAIDSLPEADAAQQAVFAARLRASPVSTFVSDPSTANAQFEQFFLVSEIALLSRDTGWKIGFDGEEHDLTAFADRVSALVGAFNPKHRRIGFLRILDEADEFPMAISDVQSALDRIGFDMLVLMIGGQPKSSCENSQALHYSLVSGLADRAPFGDGDGISTAGEVEAYLNRALNRLVERDPACGPKYSLLMKSSNDPAQELVSFSGRSPFTEVETRLYNETFEAMFLMDSDDRSGVEEFLATCTYCPNEVALQGHLRDMEEYARASALEAEIWNRIKDDTDSARLAIYLDNCTLCSYRGEVEAKIADIAAKEAAFEAEMKAFNTAVENRDVASLRSYVETCIACTNRSEAAALVAEIEADTAYQAEQAALKVALDTRDVDLMQSYLNDCDICDGRDSVVEALEVEEKRIAFSDPCLRLAAVPQLGGPRKLESIDRDRALRVCEAAANEFPEDGTLRTTLGRIAQAAGDFETARASYVFGMEAGVPSAFGLTAYSHYAPPQGGTIDLDTAEELAAKGAEMGDWLSQEILTVLYSKDLIPGKTQKDAFDIAKNIADEGNALAQFFVGYYHLTGTGTPQNPEMAAEWLTKAVEQGYTHAFSFLAELHENGTGTEQLFDRAADLYWQALQKGDPTATDRLTTQLGNRNREVIRIIQEKLRDQGVYRGTVDGIAGPGTVAAIRRYSEQLTDQG